MAEIAFPALVSHPPEVMSVSPRTKLVRMRIAATSLLALMAASFVATKTVLAHLSWAPLLGAFSEAALVGGLADWFAVTALFRRPLGLAIPHTAIIPKNKSRIGANLGEFIESNFFGDQSAAAQSDLSLLVAQWFQDTAHSRVVAERIVSVLPQLLTHLNSDDVGVILDHQVCAQLQRAELAPFLAEILELLCAEENGQVATDEVIGFLRTLLDGDTTAFETALNSVAPWFVPDFVKRKLAAHFLDRARALLDEVAADRSHELRHTIQQALLNVAADLRNDHDTQTRVRAMTAKFVGSPRFARFLELLRTRTIDRFSDVVKGSPAPLTDSIAEFIRNGAELLADDSARRAAWNIEIRAVLSKLINPQTGSLAKAIADTVERWDTRTIVEKLEMQVGSDLQFIRINGTMVGGLVGVGIYLLSNFLK